LDAFAAGANLTERQKIILGHLKVREDGLTYLAAELGKILSNEFLRAIADQAAFPG
jgi:hypothetical protein